MSSAPLHGYYSLSGKAFECPTCQQRSASEISTEDSFFGRMGHWIGSRAINDCPELFGSVIGSKRTI